MPTGTPGSHQRGDLRLHPEEASLPRPKSPRQLRYQILPRPGVEIGRSNPDTDPSGYQTVQMLELAERFYHQPGLRDSILARAPKTNMRDTETELIAALESGQIDYLAIYLSDARQHHFKDLDLPPQINLSDARYAKSYAMAAVFDRQRTVTGVPTVYAVTIPTNAAHPDSGRPSWPSCWAKRAGRPWPPMGSGPCIPPTRPTRPRPRPA